MKTMLISVGNSLRGDDGVAHLVLELLGHDLAGVTRSVLQLTPELAADMAGFETVVFLDAAVDCRAITIGEVPKPSGPASLTHVSRPSEIVALATELFGFNGRALECRIPAVDFDSREGLSARTESFARQAADLVLRDQIQPRHQ